MHLKEISEVKTALEKKANKGFGYFMKNIGMIVFMFIFIFILTNPDCIINATDYFSNFDTSSLWVVFSLFLAAVGFYQLYKSIQKDDKIKNNENTINNYEKALERKEEIEKQKHNELVKKRFEVGPLISNELKTLLINLDADRAAILEMHNGTNNMSGLPFIYADMVYEEISPNVGFASDEFKNFNLSKLPFVSLHYHDKTWIGSVNDIEEEDPYFAAKLRVVDVSYGALVILEGINGPLGFLSLFFKDEKKHPTKAKIIAEINHSSQILSGLLDKTVN